MLRDDQLALLRWVLAATAASRPEPLPEPLPEVPDLDLERLRPAGVATGLTAAVGALADLAGIELPVAWRSFVGEQIEAVATRRRRYAALLPEVLRSLDAAGVEAIPVKGAVLADALWPVPDARPMADIDVLVREPDRERAVSALVASGLTRSSSTADEDVLLAWGDGGRGPIDRESAHHNGKVELHPGWRERVHHYTVDGGGLLFASASRGTVAGAPCLVLPPHLLALHALGHLSVGVVRSEVRGVNVVDVALALRALDGDGIRDLGAACDAVDPRLTAPGLWLVATAGERPLDVDGIDRLVTNQLDRLPAAARRALTAAPPSAVLRSLGERTTLRWRLSFATTAAERAAVVRQAISPTAAEMQATGGGAATWQLQAVRARRAGARVAATARRRAARRPGAPVVYVLAGDLGAVTPVESLERWPTAGRTLAALRDAGVATVGVARTSHSGERFEHLGVTWRFVEDTSRTGWRVAAEVARCRPRVVHVNGTGPSLTWLAIRARCPLVPIVVQHHGEPPGTGRSLAAQRAVRRVVQGYLLTGGAGQAAPFVAAGVLADDTAVFDVLESSTDMRPVHPALARLRTGMTGAPAVVAVGRLTPAKDPVVLASAFCAYAATAPAAELWWVFHDDSMRGAVAAVLSEHPAVAGRVHLVGRVAADHVADWLSGADVFLSASRHEGSGYALIEALRCGCTPVVSDIAPHRAIVGAVGDRFPSGDSGLGAAALADVLIDQAAAVARFESALTWGHVAAQLRLVYDQW